jgi:hypothetical protein
VLIQMASLAVRAAVVEAQSHSARPTAQARTAALAEQGAVAVAAVVRATEQVRAATAGQVVADLQG